MTKHRALVITPASEIEPDWEGYRITEAVKAAVREVLPEAWHVLPDGRSAPSLIARLDRLAAAIHDRPAGDPMTGPARRPTP